MTQITYEMQARQQTSLTPRLQQSVKLLQMSTLDFSREVAQAIATNPFLEEPDEQAPSEDAAAVHDTDGDMLAMPAGGDGPESYADAGEPAEHAAPEPEYIAASQADAPAYSGDYPTQRNADQPDSDVGQWARSTGNLQQALRADLCSYQLSERERYLTEYIIEALDDDGYLRVPFAELANVKEFSPPVGDDEWEIALRLVQQLSTPGLAARNLTECLTLQLAALPDDTPGRAMATRIIGEALERLGRCDYAGLAKAMGCPEEEIQEACLLIRTLAPRPGGRYTSVDPSCYVIPDAFVRKIGRLWVATTNEEATPQARLNSTYAQLFRQSRYGERSLMAQALQEARWLMRSLEQRKSTIQRVAQAIVARQQTFFDYGEIALRPMMLSEIADELGMHESTISRATSNKYLASPRGIYEFKSFFSRELATQSGGTCSAVAVRALIQEMIDGENPKEPLSDVVLARKLAREGVVVARRTVSKYRSQIKCPPAELRRRPAYP
ncbi:RNA polymerase, sigma 54 subunit, RpoN/SigL [Pollutimonas bauzanensis]|uniref:RNA polymerase sigma-54 factor n=2 Tax=Pollutimonas bauzanensis TaxID=658167 RepID=A0A1M5STK9_9BURK|nr:RNA polymerase, sigma 54 subunit, RpoN/SigL [Pollutimonas bauzanensis]